MPFKDECTTCGRIFSYGYLRRCQRCNKLFCRDCTTPEVPTGDPTRMFCLHCAKKIVSQDHPDKYERLQRYLKFRSAFTNTVKISFAKMDGVIGDNLPIQAFRSQEWWSDPASPHAKAWQEIGWKIHEVSTDDGYIILKKVRNTKGRGKVRTRSRQKVKKPFTPAPVRIPKKRRPSKTKASKIHARFKNIERSKASIKKHRGHFKPKSAFEKKLYKLDEKP